MSEQVPPYNGKSRRIRERLKLSLPVRVRCRESAEYEWTEMARLLDVTPFGAAFIISHLTEIGRLLHLTLPLPRQLRLFDHVEDQYRVWALVRHIKPLEGQASAAAGKRLYQIGVAFVGKHPPSSFISDPSKRYDAGSAPRSSDDKELPTLVPFEGEPDRRNETRLNIPVETLVRVFNEKGEVAHSEETVTENISRYGVAVFTTLPVGSGRFVQLTSPRHQLTFTAVVRARRIGPDGIARLHLEIVDGEWPLEGMM